MLGSCQWAVDRIDSTGMRSSLRDEAAPAILPRASGRSFPGAGGGYRQKTAEKRPITPYPRLVGRDHGPDCKTAANADPPAPVSRRPGDWRWGFNWL